MPRETSISRESRRCKICDLVDERTFIAGIRRRHSIFLSQAQAPNCSCSIRSRISRECRDTNVDDSDKRAMRPGRGASSRTYRRHRLEGGRRDGERVLSEPASGAAVSGGVLQPTEQRIATPQGGRDPGNRLSILPVARYTARPIHSCTAVSKIRNPLPGSKSHCHPFPGPSVR